MSRGRSSSPLYRVLWFNGQDAILDEWSTPLRAIVLDTALEHAVKVAKKWLDTCVVWEIGDDGTSVRAFGTPMGLRWPEKHPCKPCKGAGKVYTAGGVWGGGGQATCDKCHGCGRIPEV